jgi:hypothetical protein
VDGIRQLFIDAATRGDSLLNEFNPDKEKISQYERKALAKRYAGLLHSIACQQHKTAKDEGIEDRAGKGR